MEGLVTPLDHNLQPAATTLVLPSIVLLPLLIPILLPLLIPILILHHPHHPSNLLFNRAQAPKVHLSVPSALDEKCVIYSSVNPAPFGMDPKPGAGRTTKDSLSPHLVWSCASTGTFEEDAQHRATKITTSVQAVETKIMALRSALKHRKNQALTPYNTSAWDLLLRECNLLKKYPNLPNSLAKGFDARIQRIYETATPGNGPTLHEQPEAYQKILIKNSNNAVILVLACV